MFLSAAEPRKRDPIYRKELKNMELKELRNSIDALDDELLKLFLQRMELCSQIAEVKAQSKKPVADAGREREILSRVTRSSPEELGRRSAILAELCPGASIPKCRAPARSPSS